MPRTMRWPQCVRPRPGQRRDTVKDSACSTSIDRQHIRSAQVGEESGPLARQGASHFILFSILKDLTGGAKVETALSIAQLLVLVITAIYVATQMRLLAHQVVAMNEQVKAMNTATQVGIDMERRRKALEFISRFNSTEMIELRGYAVQKMRTDPFAHEVVNYLNFFEELSLAVLNDLADEQVCRPFFQQIVIHTMNGCEDTLKGNPTNYRFARELRTRWQQPSNLMPSLSPHEV